MAAATKVTRDGYILYYTDRTSLYQAFANLHKKATYKTWQYRIIHRASNVLAGAGKCTQADKIQIHSIRRHGPKHHHCTVTDFVVDENAPKYPSTSLPKLEFGFAGAGDVSLFAA